MLSQLREATVRGQQFPSVSKHCECWHFTGRKKLHIGISVLAAYTLVPLSLVESSSEHTLNHNPENHTFSHMLYSEVIMYLPLLQPHSSNRALLEGLCELHWQYVVTGSPPEKSSPLRHSL